MSQTVANAFSSLTTSINDVGTVASTATTNIANLDTRVGNIEAKLAQTLDTHMLVLSTSASQTLTVPAFAKRAIVQLYGAGGAGGPGQSSGNFGRPGASGAFCEVELTNLVPESSQFSIFIGSGGAASSTDSDTATGTSGGSTSLTFGSAVYTAGGGLRGSGTTTQAAATTSGACKISRNGSVAARNLAFVIGGNVAAPGPYGGMGGWYGTAAVSTAERFGGGGAPGYYYNAQTVRDPPTSGADGGVVIWWYPY
jgi:hypothetical protein